MKTITNLKLGALALVCGLLALGCTDDDDPVDTSTGSQVSLGSAWSSFESGNWQAANDAFLSALQQAPAYAEAWCGLGWSRARLLSAGGMVSGEGVREAFARADQYGDSYVDAWAGLAEYHHWAGDTLQALEWALDAAETGGAAYSFAHAEGVDHRSLRKIAAWNHFKLGNYDEAGAQVQTVLADFSWRGRADSLAYLFETIGGL